NIYNNYFKAPWMPDRTEANPNELNQDDARYGFRCCHLKNIWTAPLPPETELSRQMTTSTTSIDIMGLQAAYANLHTDRSEERRVGKECRSWWSSDQKKKINTLKNILINKLAFENIDDLQLPLL